MKARSFLFVLLLGILLFLAFPVIKKMFTPDKHPDHELFEGSWVGEIKDGKKLTTWVQIRSADGKHTTVFLTIEGRSVGRSVKTGKWWLADSRFYEESTGLEGMPEAYEYEIISPREISFRHIGSDYAFTEKICDDTMMEDIKVR